MNEPFNDVAFKAAVVGPSRVGKTTLLTAILSETEKRLAGTQVRIVPGETTEERIRQQRASLREAIFAEEFNAAALSGNQSTSVYEIKLQADGDVGLGPGSRVTLEIPFSILDYPGGWLDPSVRARSADAQLEWPKCEAHIEQSIMLLVPIDSAVLMEAKTGQQRRSVIRLLGIVDVEEMAKKWATARAARPGEPAVLILAPLKCEKYFDDNGGDGRDAPRLKELVQRAYENTLDHVRELTKGKVDVKVVYAPIDTYGCVQLMEAEWNDLGSSGSGYLEFVGHYRFRGRNPQIREKAAATVMRELCRCVLSGEMQRFQSTVKDLRRERDIQIERKLENKGFWGTLSYYFAGEAWENRKQQEWTTQQLAAAETSRWQLHNALQMLQSDLDDPRVEVWPLS